MSTSPARLGFGSDPSGAPLTGSTLLRGAMAAAVQRFPAVFGDLAIPEDPKRFKRDLPELLVQFEARRASSAERVDVARFLAAYVPSCAVLDGMPLADALVAAPAVRIERKGTAAPGWVPEVRYAGRVWRGSEIGALADQLHRDHQLTGAAVSALKWMASEKLGQPLDLSGERFVILGAAAELAPTPYLLAAGARVLWVDVRPPPELAPDAFAGTLAHCPTAGDLLEDPVGAYAAVAAEASEGPVHLGLYAYAPGGGRELLLTTVMNAIAARLGPDAVRSVSMLVSPTTPGELQPDDRAARQVRRAAAPRWQRALARIRVLREPSHHQHGDAAVSRSIVALQGPTYLAAQYLGKMMTAESWAVDRAPLRISANVAGITHTRSLEHPLFLAGFLGARSFGIQVFRSDDTRALSTLLMLHDALNPTAPGADPAGGPAAQARRVAAQAVHGGVRSAPFVFDHTIRVAAVLGLGQRPSLLLRLRD